MAAKINSGKKDSKENEKLTFTVRTPYTGRAEHSFRLKEQLLEFARNLTISHCRPVTEDDGEVNGYDPNRGPTDQVWRTLQYTAASMVEHREIAVEWPILTFPTCLAGSNAEAKKLHEMNAKSHESKNDSKKESNASKRAANAKIVEHFESISTLDIVAQLDVIKKGKPFGAPLNILDVWDFIDAISGEVPWIRKVGEWLKEVRKPLSTDSYGQFYSSWKEQWKTFWVKQQLAVPDPDTFFCLHILSLHNPVAMSTIWPESFKSTLDSLVFTDRSLSEVKDYKGLAKLISEKMQIAENRPGKVAGGGRTSTALNRVMEVMTVSPAEKELVTLFRQASKAQKQVCIESVKSKGNAAKNTGKANAPKAKLKQVCKYFLEGKCKYGDACIRSHSTDNSGGADSRKRAASDSGSAAADDVEPTPSNPATTDTQPRGKKFQKRPDVTKIDFLSVASGVDVALRRVRKTVSQPYLVGDSGAQRTAIRSQDAASLGAVDTQLDINDYNCQNASGNDMPVSRIVSLPEPFPTALVIDMLTENLLSVLDLNRAGYNVTFRAKHHNDPCPMIVHSDDGKVLFYGDDEFRVYPSTRESLVASRPSIQPAVIPDF